MLQKLHTNTTPPTLLHILEELSCWEELEKFRLVGGTALSLQLGHRISVDIDLFTDAEYGSLDFIPIYNRLVKTYPHIIGKAPDNVGFGFSFIIGSSQSESVKLDLFYTDTFLFPPVVYKDIKMADLRDITVMKLDVISHGGRKKDFWDISELLETIPFEQMLDLYILKYTYLEKSDVVNNMTNFKYADDMQDPICLRSKYWELIKIDLEDLIQKYKSNSD